MFQSREGRGGKEGRGGRCTFKVAHKDSVDTDANDVGDDVKNDEGQGGGEAEGDVGDLTVSDVQDCN